MSDVPQKVEVNIVEPPSDGRPWPWSECGEIKIDEGDAEAIEEQFDNAAEDDGEAPERSTRYSLTAKRKAQEARCRAREKYQRYAADVVKLAELGMEPEQIAGLLGVSASSIRNGFMTEVMMGRCRGLKSILIKQHKVAADEKHKDQGNMLRWLGKQFGQRDRQEITQTINTDDQLREKTKSLMDDPDLYDKAREIIRARDAKRTN